MLTLANAVICVLLVSLLVCLGIWWLIRKTDKPSGDSGEDKSTRHDPFLVKPYLQLGDNPTLSDANKLDLVWLTGDSEALWAVEIRTGTRKRWLSADFPVEDRITIQGLAPMRRFRASIDRLPPGEEFEYRVLHNGEPVCQARGIARKTAEQPYRIVVVGDIATGRIGSRKIAYQAFQTRPDLLVVPGDVVYKHGRLSEYLHRYFPVFNRDEPHQFDGGPLLRSVPSVAALGNHDAGTPELTDVRDLDKMPDLLGFFVYWSQPLNGPFGTNGQPNTPDLQGKRQRQEDFLSAAAKNFPRMANFSFDYGNAHWLVLDANVYMDWTNHELRSWVENDLAAARSATWKFVVFHQPGFSTDRKHADEQRMRLLAPIFEKHGVDVVFSGHNHAYERNFPLRFKLEPQPDGKLISPEGRVDGQFLLDKRFDGKDNRRPDGVLYIVTGAGGGKLNLEPHRRADRSALPPFTDKLVDDIHSFTVLEVDGKRLSARQVTEDGDVIDSFVIEK